MRSGRELAVVTKHADEQQSLGKHAHDNALRSVLDLGANVAQEDDHGVGANRDAMRGNSTWRETGQVPV